MQNDDEVRNETSGEPNIVRRGRRATYTPPLRMAAAPVNDDEELETALSAGLNWLSTGAVPIVAPDTAPLDEDDDNAVDDPAPVQDEDPSPEPDAQSATTGVPPWASLPAPDPTHAVHLSAAPESSAPEVTSDEEPAAADEEPTVDEPAFEPTAWEPQTWEPEPEPEQAATDPLPESTVPHAAPVRQSLADDELASLVEDPAAREGGTLGLIEQFEQQLRLREEEAQKFSEWENTMLSLGTEDAVSEVEAVRTQFTGVIPIITPAMAAAAASGEDAEPAVVEPEPAAAEPEITESEPEASEPEAVEPEISEPQLSVPPAWPSWASVSIPAPDVVEPVAPESEGSEQEPPVIEAEEAPAEASEPDTNAETIEESDVEEAPAVAEAPVASESATAENEPEPWWLDEPVADEGIIAEPSAAVDVAEPVIEPELLEPEGAPEEILEAKVVEEPEAQPEPEPEPEIQPEPEPEPYVPPALIEPPGYGAPVPTAEPDHVPVIAPATGDTGEVILAEMVENDIVEVDAEPEQPVSGFVFDAEGAGTRSVPTTAPEPAFEEFLAGTLGEEPPQRYDPEPTTQQDAGAEALFIEPMRVAAGQSVPIDTGSITIIDRAYEEELDDDVDDTDRAFGPVIGGITVSAAGTGEVSAPFSPPSEPISIVRLRDDEMVIANNEPIRTPIFSIEGSGPEPTPIDRRVGHAARLFWLWFAANSSILSIALGAVIFGLGMSLRQSIVAVLIGIALSFIPLGLSSLAGKRSGQPTMIVSRATFGIMGNILPSAIALLTRLFWGAVLLWLLASSVAMVLAGQFSTGALVNERQIFLISLAAAFLVALLVAFAGYHLLARIQLILSIISGALIFGLVLLTVTHIDIPAALGTQDGPWILVITGAVLVFSFVGLVWATSGADLARYQRPTSGGASTMLWSTFGATLPAFLLIGYGALLSASDRGLASGFATDPLETLASILPGWYPIPLVAATALSLLSGVVLTLYSGAFALQSIGLRLSRQWSTVIVGVAVALLALVFTFAITGGIGGLFRDLATTLAVPTAAWVGIFAAETMIRNRPLDSASLLSRGGRYPDVRWNVVGLVVISVLGWGFTTAVVSWLGWQGYLFAAFGVPLDSDLAGTDVGVLIALGLGLLLPIVSGIPAIRRQEDVRVEAG
ncbi:MAG: cytosine permease [Rhodoglobus sp.]